MRCSSGWCFTLPPLALRSHVLRLPTRMPRPLLRKLYFIRGRSEIKLVFLYKARCDDRGFWERTLPQKEQIEILKREYICIPSGVRFTENKVKRSKRRFENFDFLSSSLFGLVHFGQFIAAQINCRALKICPHRFCENLGKPWGTHYIAAIRMYIYRERETERRKQVVERLGSWSLAERESDKKIRQISGLNRGSFVP